MKKIKLLLLSIICLGFYRSAYSAADLEGEPPAKRRKLVTEALAQRKEKKEADKRLALKRAQQGVAEAAVADLKNRLHQMMAQLAVREAEFERIKVEEGECDVYVASLPNDDDLRAELTPQSLEEFNAHMEREAYEQAAQKYIVENGGVLGSKNRISTALKKAIDTNQDDGLIRSIFNLYRENNELLYAFDILEWALKSKNPEKVFMLAELTKNIESVCKRGRPEFDCSPRAERRGIYGTNGFGKNCIYQLFEHDCGISGTKHRDVYRSSISPFYLGEFDLAFLRQKFFIVKELAERFKLE